MIRSLVQRLSGFLRRESRPRYADEAVVLNPGTAELPDAEAFESVTGLRVQDIEPYLQAMRHRSVLRGNPASPAASNERLEYLGDAVVGFITAEHLYAQYPDEDEGYLTRLRAKLVSGKALAQRARAIGLDRLIVVSENLRQQGQTHRLTSVMADAMEALIGAVYLDRGIDAARQFVHRAILDPLDFDELMQLEDNHKSLLLELVQSQGLPQPTYRVVDAVGPSHERTFTVEVLVDGQSKGVGEARSKKQAEQRAAGVALVAVREEISGAT